MASTDATLEGLKEQFLICCICEYQYDDETREPRILPCLHTYCTLCIRMMIKDKSLSCPQCRELHQVPDNDVNTFKKDNSRRELLDFVTVRTKDPGLICNMCDDNKEENKAVACCFECAQFLCNKCIKSHRGCKFTKDHEVVNVDQLQKSDLDNFTHIQFCPVIGHENNKLSLYCEKCETIVCIHCTATTHKAADGHVIRNVDEVSVEEMENVRQLLQETEYLKMRAGDIIEKVEQRLASLANVEKDVHSEIEAMIKNCIEMLIRRQVELKMELSRICSHKRKVLEHQLQHAKQHEQNIFDSIQFATQTLQHRNPANFLEIRKVIMDRFYRLLQEPLDNLPHENDKITLKHINLTEFQMQVLTHGKIWSTSVYPPKTEVKLFDLIQPGHQTVLKIQLCNYQGEPQTADDVLVQIDIKDPDDMEMQPEVKYEDNGQVALTCDITKQGCYTARVCILETEVWKGKFQLLPGNGKEVCPQGTKAYVDFLSVEEARKIYLECPSCHEEFGFETDGDIPILLPCLHSVGKKCATRYFQHFKLQCPICNIVHEMQNLEVMPIDPTKDVLKKYLDIREGRIPCSNNCVNQSHIRCMECRVFLCEACFINHQQNLMLRDHSVRLLKEIRDSETLIDISKVSMCTVRGHDKNELIVFCESCDVLVCNTCALSKQHKSETHNTETDLMNIYDNKRSSVSNGMDLLRTRREKLECVIRAVEQERMEAKINLHNVLNDINEAIESRRKCLTIQASKFATTVIENLDTQLERLRTYERYIEETRNVVTEKLSFCGEVAFITVEKILSQRMKELIDKQYDNYPCQISSLRFLKDNTKQASSETILNLGFLWISDVCPWKTEVELYSEVFTGENTRVFSLHLFTFEGNISLFQDGMVQAKITDPNGKLLQVKLEARKESCNVLDAHIHSEKAGKHEFHIEVLRRTFKDGNGSFVVRDRASVPIATPQQSDASSNISTIHTDAMTTTTAPLNMTISSSAKALTGTAESERSKLTKEKTTTTSLDSDKGNFVGTTTTADRASAPIATPQQSDVSSNISTIHTDAMTTTTAPLNVTISSSAKALTGTAESERSKLTKEKTTTTSLDSDKGNFVGTTTTAVLHILDRASAPTPVPLHIESSSSLLATKTTKTELSNMTTQATRTIPTETTRSEKFKSIEKETRTELFHADTGNVVGITSATERTFQKTPPDRSPDSQLSSRNKQIIYDDQSETSMSFAEIQCPEFSFDSATVHATTQVTQEGKLLLSTGTCSPNPQFKMYKGTKATRSFKEAGKYYFEVTVSFTVRRYLTRGDLVFEVGLCRLEDIDKYESVSIHMHGRSFAVTRDPENGKLAKRFRHECRHLRCIPSWENREGLNVSVTYGFLLDTEQGKWMIVDTESNCIMYTFDKIDLSEPLFPVFGCYNSDRVHVAMLLKTGSVIKSIPACLKQNRYATLRREKKIL